MTERLATDEDAPDAATLIRQPPKPALLENLARPFGDRHGAQAALTAILAWAITIAPAGFARAAPPSGALLGFLALAAGVSGPLLAPKRRRLGRHLGISAFLGLATITWLAGSTVIEPVRLEPIRAAIGAVAWGLFALSWSSPKEPPQTQVADPTSPILHARATLPPYAVAIAAFGILVGLACLAMAWRTREVDRAMLAHAVALACAVALVTASASIAIGRSRARVGGSRRVSGPAARALILFGIAIAAGIAVILAR